MVSAGAGRKGRARALAFSAHARNCRRERLLHDARHKLGCGHGRGRVCPHAASVWSCVTLANPLVVLGGGERDDSVAVGEGEDRDFGAGEELLYNNLAAWRPSSVYCYQSIPAVTYLRIRTRLTP